MGGKEVVFDAGSSGELYDYLKKNTVDVVLLDVFFPDENGLDILSTLKTIDKKIKVLVVTGMNQRAITDEARRLGADGILFKPFGTDELFAELDKLKK